MDMEVDQSDICQGLLLLLLLLAQTGRDDSNDSNEYQ